MFMWGRALCVQGYWFWKKPFRQVVYMNRPNVAVKYNASYQYAWPNDKLPSVKHAVLPAKREMPGLKTHLPPRFWMAAEISNNFARPMRSLGHYFKVGVGEFFVDEFAFAHFVVVYCKQQGNLFGSCIVATTFHTIVLPYISVKHVSLWNKFVRFGFVYW